MLRGIQFTTAFVTTLDKDIIGLLSSSKSDLSSSSQEVTLSQTRRSMRSQKKTDDAISIVAPSKSVVAPSKSLSTCCGWELVQELLIISLSHESPLIRSSGLDCLKTIKNKLNQQDIISKFIGNLLEYETEIKTDPE